ncbi:MAG: hypothetical protein ACP5JG_08200 [Anaerolineae bacterium]
MRDAHLPYRVALAILLASLIVPLAHSPRLLSAATTATTITVTSTDDDTADGKSKKCSDVPANQCTLRRAINQAYSIASTSNPVTIAFDIPANDPGYDSSNQVWIIQIEGSSTYDLRELYGNTTVDGTTQPGGRGNGPKIVVDGQGTHNYGFIMRQDGNVVRGLAMQNFKTAHISVASDGNTIEDCWFGLSADGMTLSSGSDTDPEGGTGVGFAAGVSQNVVQDNVFAGNLVGTRADGTVPIPVQFSQHPCLSGAWTGGVGITVFDSGNQIGGPTETEGNILAGLFLDIGPTTTQSPAIDLSGSGHVVQNNVIGLDANDNVVGVCGRGIDMGNAPKNVQLLDNVLVETGLSSILMNGSLLNGNTLYGNIIRRASAWPGEQGFNQFAEDAIAYGPYVPSALQTFQPARITNINGTSVTGTSGQGSPCGRCTIELFLDDTDAVTETLQSLAQVTAGASGNWSATLPSPLRSDQGLRTMSTVPDSFTIIGLDPGTTSNLSALQGADFRIFLPLGLRNM